LSKPITGYRNHLKIAWSSIKSIFRASEMTLINSRAANVRLFSSTLRSSTSNAFVFLIILLLVSMILSSYATTSYYSTSDNEIASDFLEDYSDSIARILLNNRKRISPSRRRSCLRRGATCDHRPSDCCYSSTCRCNLWGTNCRCQRMGLFSKWG